MRPFWLHNPGSYVSAALLLLLACPGFPEERPGPGLPLDERAYLAGRVYASLAYFAHWQDVPGIDVQAAFKGYVGKAMASEDRFVFSRAMMEFLAVFRNGHTMFLNTALIKQGGSLPFEAQFIAGKWIVTASRVAGLNPGDVIERIDERPFEQFLVECRRFIATSTEQWARRALFAKLPPFTPYAHLFPERFVLRLVAGREVSVDRRAITDAPAAVTEGRWIEPGKVAYVRIPSFFRPEYEKRALELVRQYSSAAVLIVDVRGNSGGSTPSGLTSLLMDRPYRWWTESTPLTFPYFRFRASQGGWQYQPFDRPDFVWRSSEQPASKDAFKGKLALLADAGCFSACEDFTMPFKDNGRALIVGETTGGSTGQPYTLDLGDGMTVLVGAKREMFPDGSRFEGVGIKPDVEIAPTAEDIRQGKDVVLEAARKRLAGL